MDYSNYLGTEIAAEAPGPTEPSLRSGFIIMTLLAIIVLLTLLALDQCGVVLPVVDEFTMTVAR